jgi:hypothetical protein
MGTMTQTCQRRSASALKLIPVGHMEAAHDIGQLDHEYGNISELTRAQLNTKLRSLEKSLGIIQEFGHIQREIEFYSGSMFAEDEQWWILAAIRERIIAFVGP